MNQNCVIYCRVSTPKQAQEGESLDTQESICKNIIKTKGYSLLPNGVFKEPFSGRRDHRPIFDEMMSYISKNVGKVNYVVVRVIDRFTRGGSLSYETLKTGLSKFGVELIDSYGIIQPAQNSLKHLDIEYDWSKFCPSETAEIVVASYGKMEVRNILTRLIGREIELTREGYQIGPAHDGFVNKKTYIEGKKRTIQSPDLERAKFFIKMFEMRASGCYSDPEIVEKINAMGFKTKITNKWNKGHDKIIGSKGGKPLTLKRLQRFIQRPIYCGIICKKWTNYQAVKACFEGLVSFDTFNRANRGKVFVEALEEGKYHILYDYKPLKTKNAKIKNNPQFPFKNVVLCPDCKKPFLGSSPKGKSGKYFPIYHCSRNHKYLGIKKVVFEDNVIKFIKNLQFSSSLISKLETSLTKKWRERQKEILKETAQMGKALSELQIEKEQIIETLLVCRSEVARTEIEKRLDLIEDQINMAKEQRNDFEISESDIQQFINFAKYLMEHLEELLLDRSHIQRQRALFGLIFEELPTYQDILNGTPKLSLIFQQKKDSSKEKPQSVIRVGFEPTTISLKGCCSTS
jgi:site-specific DNA recombinase